MPPHSLRQDPLSPSEIDQLIAFLNQLPIPGAMSMEELDGFFTALIAGPELVPPSEYLPEIFGGDMSERVTFPDLDEANRILGLIIRHSNDIATTLLNGDAHLPVVLEDANGHWTATRWARGFMRGVDMRKPAWLPLFRDDSQAGCLIPVLILIHEHDEDPELRPGPISEKMRADLISHMAAGAVAAYRYFRRHPSPLTRAPKPGRNELCPCGSGRKYKRCCASRPPS